MSETHSLPQPYTGRTHWWKQRWQDYEEYRESYFSRTSSRDDGYLVGDIVYIQYTVDGEYDDGIYRQVINVEDAQATRFVRLTIAPVDERDVKAAGVAWEGK